MFNNRDNPYFCFRRRLLHNEPAKKHSNPGNYTGTGTETGSARDKQSATGHKNKSTIARDAKTFA